MSTLYQSSPIIPSPSDSSDYLDSPSRQLLRELRLLHIQDRRTFYEKLEEEEHRLAQEHEAGLAAAAAKHEAVRRDAEECLRQYNLEVERQRKKEEEERRKREETIEREKKEREEAERRRQAAEKAKAEEAARKAAKEKAKAEAAERERQEAKKREAEEQARQKRDAEQKAKQAENAKELARVEKERVEKTAAEKATAAAAQAQARPSSQADKDAEQARYIEIHQQLKKFRAYMKDESKKNPTLKTHMGDMRRSIRKCVGQLTDVKGANKKPQEEIFTILRQARSLQEPTVDLRQFLAYPPPELAATPQPAPALLIYLLNIFSKYVIAQFVGESAVDTKSADPVGILVAQVFSSPEFKYQGQYTMIDILLAKFRFVCPVLWGVYGDERTPAGKKRIGWQYDKDTNQFIGDQRHGERMTGLGAGFAAIALRNFENSKNPNPFPNSNYWKCLANIINVPPNEIQPTHFIVLKSMIENQEEKILSFFGNAGLVALRKALVEFPACVPKKTPESNAVALLAELLSLQKNFHLTDL